MASQAYYDWKAAGEPYTRARPTLEFLQMLRGHGYTVYDYPDIDHLTAEPPEDHTPFSATGWPIASKRWVGHAVDVMPPAVSSALPTLPNLARQIIKDKDAKVHGTEWIKYMNWTDEDGICRKERWWLDGSRTTTSSTDKGHVHISGRSDMDTSDVVSASGWDPVARLRGTDMSLTPAEHNTQIAIDARVRTLMFDADFADFQLLNSDGTPGETRHEANKSKAARAAIAADVAELKARPPVTFTAEQIAALANAIAAELIASDANALTMADHDGIVADVKSALREGSAT
jgi:hypothetical protein